MKDGEEYEKYVDMRNACYIKRKEKNKTISYFTGFDDGAEFGYNKANEWHYVKDGKFPTDRTEKEYLVALKSEYGGFFYETDIWCESLHCFASNNPTKVYAWKEIGLPELKESE